MFYRMEQLANLGDDAVPLLTDFLDSEDQNCVEGCAEGLRKLGPKARSAVPKLESALKRQAAEPNSRFYVARALWQIDNRNAAVLPVLIELLDSYLTIDSTADLMGEIGPDAKDATAALKRQLDRGWLEVAQLHFDAFGVLAVNVRCHHPNA